MREHLVNCIVHVTDALRLGSVELLGVLLLKLRNLLLVRVLEHLAHVPSLVAEALLDGLDLRCLVFLDLKAKLVLNEELFLLPL